MARASALPPFSRHSLHLLQRWSILPRPFQHVKSPGSKPRGLHMCGIVSHLSIEPSITPIHALWREKCAFSCIGVPQLFQVGVHFMLSWMDVVNVSGGFLRLGGACCFSKHGQTCVSWCVICCYHLPSFGCFTAHDIDFLSRQLLAEIFSQNPGTSLSFGLLYIGLWLFTEPVISSDLITNLAPPPSLALCPHSTISFS